MRALAIVALLACSTAHAGQVRSLEVTLLSTMLADAGVGEWGFAALVEADGQRILFDTGGHPDTVERNAKLLGIDLSTITDVVVSHNHGDHTGGLLALRRALMKKNKAALSRAHIGMGALWSRHDGKEEHNRLLRDRAEYEASGGRLVEHDKPVELRPGVWLTGPVPRVHPERNFPPGGRVAAPAGTVDDTIPEDQSLVFDTKDGLVMLSGCGHAGIINAAIYARKVVREAPLTAAVGGFHLFDADDKTLSWTFGKLRELGLAQLLGAHCTGLEAVYRARSELGLPRKKCLVGAVGARFRLDRGIDPLRVAK